MPNNGLRVAFAIAILFFAPAAAGFGREEKKPDYAPAAQKVKVAVEPELRGKGNAKNDAVIAHLEDAKTWEGYFKIAHERLGISLPEGLPVAVTLKAQNTYPRRGMGSVGKGQSGSMWISVPAIVQSAEAKKLDLTATIDNIVSHELIHCLQQDASGKDLTPKWPTWLTEGMADFIAYEKPNAAEMRALAQMADQDIDSTKGTPAYMRVRGWAFFKFLQEVHTSEKAKKFIGSLLNGEDYKKAAETAAGASWDALKKAEQTWTKEYATKK